MPVHPDSFEQGAGQVESVEKDKTKDHDSIVVRLKDGRRVVISNNTKLGKRILPILGSYLTYYGYRVDGTNVVHKTHPNKNSRGGWLEAKTAQYWGDVALGQDATANEGQAVIVFEGKKQVAFDTLRAAADYLTAVGMLPRSKIEKMLRSRKPLINGRQVAYPEGSEKTAEYNGRRSDILKNLAAASTLALPIGAFVLSRGKLRNANNLAEKTFEKFNRRISFKNMMKLYGDEMLDYSKHGWKLELPSIRSIVDTTTGASFGTGGSNASLSSVSFNAPRTAKLNMGVKGGIEAAKKTGVNANVFLHELGHAHQAYAQPRFSDNRSVLGVLLERLRSKFMPLKYNPMYQEEMRAWNNAMKLGKIDPQAMDAALNTYRTAIRGNQAVLGTGALSGLAVGSRISSRRNKRGAV